MNDAEVKYDQVSQLNQKINVYPENGVKNLNIEGNDSKIRVRRTRRTGRRAVGDVVGSVPIKRWFGERQDL